MDAGSERMKERRQIIIETAMVMFARKGYHTTSMQEVADNCGMAKGSLYNHFRSKEDLLFSIYKYYYELMYEKLAKVSRDLSLAPKERLVEQIRLQLKEFVSYRDFIQMQMREQAIQTTEEINQFLFKKRAESLLWHRDRIVDIYGRDVEEYAFDCATILSGMIKEYLGYIIIDHQEFDLGKLSGFLVNRLDDLVAGLMSKQEHILTPQMMGSFIDNGSFGSNRHQEALRHTRKMMDELEGAQLSDEDSRKLKELLIQLESKLEEDNMADIQGLLLSIAGLSTAELNERWKSLYHSVEK